jgi:hypothetical protein
VVTPFSTPAPTHAFLAKFFLESKGEYSFQNELMEAVD